MPDVSVWASTSTKVRFRVFTVRAISSRVASVVAFIAALPGSKVKVAGIRTTMAAADLEHVEADPRRLAPQLGIKVGHVGARLRRHRAAGSSPRASLPRASAVAADDVAHQIGRGNSKGP